MESRTEHNIVKDAQDLALVGFAILPIGVAFVVGTASYLVSANGPGWLGYEHLYLLTLGLALVFGASMSSLHGFLMSLVVAIAVLVGAIIGQGDVGQQFDDGAFFIVLGGTAVTILVLAAWLGGAVIGSVWRRIADR